MPNKPAARKALRQTKKHVVQNEIRRSAFKTAIKNVLKAKSSEEAKKLISAAQKALDKAAKSGVIKKNTASRRLSRLMSKINSKK
jgi:small subunit ribosomal protein S20